MCLNICVVINDWSMIDLNIVRLLSLTKFVVVCEGVSLYVVAAQSREHSSEILRCSCNVVDWVHVQSLRGHHVTRCF